MAPDLISTRAAAKLLGVTPRTILRRAQSGDLKSSKLDGRTGAYVFVRADVINYRERQNR